MSFLQLVRGYRLMDHQDESLTTDLIHIAQETLDFFHSDTSAIWKLNLTDCSNNEMYLAQGNRIMIIKEDGHRFIEKKSV